MKNEKGFSMTELLVALALSSIIAVGGLAIVVHVLRVTNQTSDWGRVTHQTQIVGYWVSHDMLMADEILPDDDPVTTGTEFATMRWNEWETGYFHNVRYVLSTSGPPFTIERIYHIDDIEGEPVQHTTKVIADSIYEAQITDEGGDIWKLTLESQSGTKTKYAQYDINPRLSYAEFEE